jgi:hypothetical protein
MPQPLQRRFRGQLGDDGLRGQRNVYAQECATLDTATQARRVGESLLRGPPHTRAEQREAGASSPLGELGGVPPALTAQQRQHALPSVTLLHERNASTIQALHRGQSACAGLLQQRQGMAFPNQTDQRRAKIPPQHLVNRYAKGRADLRGAQPLDRGL